MLGSSGLSAIRESSLGWEHTIVLQIMRPCAKLTFTADHLLKMQVGKGVWVLMDSEGVVVDWLTASNVSC